MCWVEFSSLDFSSLICGNEGKLTILMTWNPPPQDVASLPQSSHNPSQSSSKLALSRQARDKKNGRKKKQNSSKNKNLLRLLHSRRRHCHFCCFRFPQSLPSPHFLPPWSRSSGSSSQPWHDNILLYRRRPAISLLVCAHFLSTSPEQHHQRQNGTKLRNAAYQKKGIMTLWWDEVFAS